MQGSEFTTEFCSCPEFLTNLGQSSNWLIVGTTLRAKCVCSELLCLQTGGETTMSSPVTAVRTVALLPIQQVTADNM